MTAFAACLFALAAIASAWTIITSWHRHGRRALALRSHLAMCPDTLVISWQAIERVPVPALRQLRLSRAGRRDRGLTAPGLEWPGMASAA